MFSARRNCDKIQTVLDKLEGLSVMNKEAYCDICLKITSHEKGFAMIQWWKCTVCDNLITNPKKAEQIGLRIVSA